ncbi:formate dehydrogenase subunit delta [Taklimakanibacter lacteus]|uniref:formate dehydrogenase subunit delta n=1 Tax=Taklimakanibacter lacteus TaxID=2268456 RepID=UPI000E6618B4
MSDHKEIQRMANQIAKAFGAYPEEQAIKETANHIKSFWDPRMRKQLAEIIARDKTALNPVALAAGRQLGLG